MPFPCSDGDSMEILVEFENLSAAPFEAKLKLCTTSPTLVKGRGPSLSSILMPI